MVAVASEPGLDGARVLEIGGGIGALQAELLGAGAEQGEVVELVAAFEPYARELARERGLEERTSFRIVDVLEEPEAVEPADVVAHEPRRLLLAGRRRARPPRGRARAAHARPQLPA